MRLTTRSRRGLPQEHARGRYVILQIYSTPNTWHQDAAATKCKLNRHAPDTSPLTTHHPTPDIRHPTPDTRHPTPYTLQRSNKTSKQRREGRKRAEARRKLAEDQDPGAVGADTELGLELGSGLRLGLGENALTGGSKSAAVPVEARSSTRFGSYGNASNASNTNGTRPGHHPRAQSRSRGSSEGSASGGSPTTHHYLYS